ARPPRQTRLGARAVLGRCAPCEPTPARLSPRAPDQPPRGSRRAQLERFRARPPPATPPGAGSTGGGPAPPRRGRLLALGRGPPAGRLLRGGHLGLRARPLDQLDHRERRRVPVARAQLDGPSFTPATRWRMNYGVSFSRCMRRRSSSSREGKFSSRMPSESPISCRNSLISFSDLRPKFLVLSISCSVFCTSSPMYLMSAFCR